MILKTIIKNLNDLGKLQLKCGSFKRGLKNLVQCVHLHKSDSVHQAAAAIEIGHVYCRTYGEHDKALHYYTFGLKSAKKCHDSKSAQAEAPGLPVSSWTVSSFTHCMSKHDQHDMPQRHWLPQPLRKKISCL